MKFSALRHIGLQLCRQTVRVKTVRLKTFRLKTFGSSEEGSCLFVLCDCRDLVSEHLVNQCLKSTYLKLNKLVSRISCSVLPKCQR